MTGTITPAPGLAAALRVPLPAVPMEAAPAAAAIDAVSPSLHRGEALPGRQGSAGPAETPARRLPPEEPLVLGGEGRRLVGLLTRPGAGRALGLACLLLNVGVTHRVGPHRINVKLARRLAAQGVTCLRLDLAGIGDSAAAGLGLGYREQALRDLTTALDHLDAAEGLRRVLVFGICSGAAHAYALAQVDPRVAGLLLFDGHAYPSARALRRRMLHRAAALPGNGAVRDKTRRWLGRLQARLLGKAGRSIVQAAHEKPSAAEYAAGLARLAARGVALQLVYSGTVHVSDRPEDPLHGLGPAGLPPGIGYRFLPGIDHTVTLVSAQQALIELVCDWAAAAAAPPGRAAD